MTQADTADAPSEPLPGPMQDWLRHLEANRRYSPHTLAGYRRELHFLHELAGKAGQPLDKLANGHIRQFVARLHAQGRGPRSLARTLAAWRGFYKWWAPAMDMAGNPVAGVRAPKAPRALPKALSVDQTQALLDRAPAQVANEPAALRDQAMFELFYSSGLRLSELVGLDLRYERSAQYESRGWLNLDEAEVVVLGKGGKRRSVPVGQAALAALRKWIAARPQLMPFSAAPEDAAALFLARAAAASRRAWCSCSWRAWRARPACPRMCIRTCCGTASPATCCNRPRTCAPYRKCWATPTSPPPRSTRAWTSSIWPRPTIRRIRAPAASPDGVRSRTPQPPPASIPPSSRMPSNSTARAAKASTP